MHPQLTIVYEKIINPKSPAVAKLATLDHPAKNTQSAAFNMRPVPGLFVQETPDRSECNPN